MLKPSLGLAGFLLLVFFVTLKATGLALTFYILFPLLIIPALLFIVVFPRLWGLPMAALAVSYFFYAAFHLSLETGLLGAGSFALIGVFFLYRDHWQRVLARQTSLSGQALEELTLLQRKHHSRLESLHHLEKQVAGLLSLFEIARDFNDSLSYEAMQDLLSKRVLPELPFQRFRIFLFEPGQDISAGRCVIASSSEDGYQAPFSEELSENEKHQIASVRESKKMLQNDRNLILPLLADGEMSAAVMVEGIHPDDLVKFEVLSAYMALQVRKIKLYETVKELSIRDGLTGVFVRRHFHARFDEELKRSIKYGLPLAVLMLDIDLFKRYNDEYGHLAGDATLKQVAQMLCESLRKVDIVARYGGEEFVVVIPDARKTGAYEVAERVRSSIARHQFKVFNDQTKVTVSIGIALFPEDAQQVPASADTSQPAFELIQCADRALYCAKEEGRNRIVFYQDL